MVVVRGIVVGVDAMDEVIAGGTGRDGCHAHASCAAADMVIPHPHDPVAGVDDAAACTRRVGGMSVRSVIAQDQMIR